MPGQYYLNLEEFSLERFKHTLETGKLLPARQILKEDLEARFGVLASKGIHNLSELIAALKTRPKIEAFSSGSRLPVEYLVILGREARSYLPKPVYLREIPGLDRGDVEKLEAAGVKHSKHLFERGRTKDARETLSANTGVPMERLLELVKLSDLARVLGVGAANARLLYEAGADTIESLSRCDPEELSRAAHAVNREQRITKAVPSLKDIAHYVAMAGELDKAIEYE